MSDEKIQLLKEDLDELQLASALICAFIIVILLSLIFLILSMVISAKLLVGLSVAVIILFSSLICGLSIMLLCWTTKLKSYYDAPSLFKDTSIQISKLLKDFNNRDRNKIIRYAKSGLE